MKITNVKTWKPLQLKSRKYKYTQVITYEFENNEERMNLRTSDILKLLINVTNDVVDPDKINWDHSEKQVKISYKLLSVPTKDFEYEFKTHKGNILFRLKKRLKNRNSFKQTRQ